MNNEPVAWRRMEENGWYVYYETECWDDLIPLYTHPAKTLTDGEILNTWKKCGESDIAKDMQANSFLKYFARAIIRKAQEK